MKNYVILAAAAVLLGAGGCSGDPALFLGGPAGPAVSVQLSTSSLDLLAGNSVTLGAQPRDEVGNAASETASFAACDAGVTVTAGTPTEQWAQVATVTANAIGESCVTVTAGGITETVRVRMSPGAVLIAGPDTVQSGFPAQFTVEFYSTDGTALSAPADYPIPAVSSTNTLRLPVTEVDASTYDAFGQQPGAVRLQASTDPSLGAVVTSEKFVIIVPGVFGGTVSATTADQGAPVTVTAALTWDDDVHVLLGGEVAGLWSGVAADPLTDPTTGSLTFWVPWNLAPGDYDLIVVNQGPGQIAEKVTTPFTVTAGTLVNNQQGFPGLNTSGAELIDKISLDRPLAWPVVHDPNVTGSTTTYYTLDNVNSAGGNAGEIVARITLDWVDACGEVCDPAASEDVDIQIIDGAFTVFLDSDGRTLKVPESTLYNFNNNEFFFVRYQTFSGAAASHTVFEWLGDGNLCSDGDGCTINGEV